MSETWGKRHQNPSPSFAGVHPVPYTGDRTSDHPLGLTGRSSILPISLDLPLSLSLSISISIFSRSHGEDGVLVWAFQKGLRDKSWIIRFKTP
jgi:hypothetical protein